MHTAGSDYVESAHFSQFSCGSNIQPAAQTVPADIGKDNGTQSQGPHLECKVSSRDAAIILPATHAHESVACINSHSNFFRAKFFQRVSNYIGLFNRDRAKY